MQQPPPIHPDASVNGTTAAPPAPILAAASVIIVRDASNGPEVFLVQRHADSQVLGGAYVFPGGKLDHEDQTPAAVAFLDRTPQQLHAALAEPDLTPAQAQGLFVAAIREAFEECGVGFWERDAASTVTAMPSPQLPFIDAIRAAQLRLHTAALLPWSRWITPQASTLASKRFDTRFFIATMPAGQTARHDMQETTASCWLTPRQALQRYWDQEIALAPPQIMTLAHLHRFGDVASMLEAARQSRPYRVLPEPVQDGAQRVLCYPGDPQHSVAIRAMPGPTRLYIRHKRFEPLGGLEDLLSH